MPQSLASFPGRGAALLSGTAGAKLFTSEMIPEGYDTVRRVHGFERPAYMKGLTVACTVTQNHSWKSFTASSEVTNFTVVIWVIYCTVASKDRTLWAVRSWCNA